MKDTNLLLPIESIQERDVDLILLEEFYTDDSFCEWFIDELGFPALTNKVGVWRSISDFGLGETDLLFAYISNDTKIGILIENKLDASFQDEQYNRYFKRAEEYVKKERFDKAFVVLVAPDLYCKNQSDFDFYISYEKIAERFAFTGSNRNLFKRELLQIASEKLRRGYQPINSEIVQAFWINYWQFKEEHFPCLEMKKPSIVPYNSDWPMLTDKRIMKVQFYHKFGQGNIDATFKGISEEQEGIIKQLLSDNIKLVKHSKSYSLRIFTDKIDRTKKFQDEKNKVEEGLKQMEYLRDWILNHRILD
jgi:hypothetical protein